MSTLISPADPVISPGGTVGSDSSRNSSMKRKEVDYYLNPTELFRWINYRRWDGAKARAQSHPDECSTWIVSRHSSDGRILWRHLPLHLVCMQSEPGSGGADSQSNAMQVEQLIDVLIEAYPEAASSPDDQGMLPLHLAVANSAHPNERILNILLMAYPTAVETKDKYGRTPFDLVNEHAENGPYREAALRAMTRAQRTTKKLVESMENENTSILESMKQTSTNERMASQRLIMRLEQDLQEARNNIKQLEDQNKNGENSVQGLRNEISSLKDQVNLSQTTVTSVRRERDELLNQNELLRSQVQENDKIVKKLHQEFEEERQHQSDTIATLRSEVSTAKAMAAALESQLRSRFADEEYLSNSVSELETQIADMKSTFQQEKKKLLHERDGYENENTVLKRNNDDLTKKNSALQSKLTELSKQMSGVLSSHGALNAEHDRIMDANLRMEADLVENVRTERTQMLSSIKKQWEYFESAIREQEQMLEEFQHKEMELLQSAKDERDRSVEVISRMRQDFREARASSLDRQRILQSDTISIRSSSVAPSVTSARSSSSTIKESRKSPMQQGNSSTRKQQPQPEQQTSSQQPMHQHLDPPTMQVEIMENKKDIGSSLYNNNRNGRAPSNVPPMVDSRLPPPTTNTNNPGLGQQRQGPEQQSSLLQMLEQRADQSGNHHHRHLRYSSSEGTYGLSTGESSSGSSAGRNRSSLHHHHPQQGATRPRTINVSNLPSSGNRMVSFDNLTMSSASSPGNAVGSLSKSSSRSKNRNNHNNNLASLSLDEYSHASSSGASSVGDDSDTDSSSAPRGNSGNNNRMRSRSVGKSRSSNQFSGMEAGLRMGMIRIAEEGSIDGDSRYSR